MHGTSGLKIGIFRHCGKQWPEYLKYSHAAFENKLAVNEEPIYVTIQIHFQRWYQTEY